MRYTIRLFEMQERAWSKMQFQSLFRFLTKDGGKLLSSSNNHCALWCPSYYSAALRACNIIYMEAGVYATSNSIVETKHSLCTSLVLLWNSWLGFVFRSFQAALQKQQQQQQADLMGQSTLESSSFNCGEPIPASAAGPLCAASPPVGEEAPTVNGGQSDSYSESMDREQEPELAEEVSENGPLLGWWP